MDKKQTNEVDEVNFFQNKQTTESTTIFNMNSQIKIRIQKRESRGSALKKHTTYLIVGEDRKGQISVWRRFNQFNQMRLAMVRTWPGCLIPSLPSKNPMVKNQEEINRKRQRYLDDFLKKVAQRSFLFYSDQFQTFLRSETTNVSELFEKWATPTPQSIINKYKSTFSDLDGKQISSTTINEIFQFTKRLQFNQQKLIGYRKVAKELAFQRDRFNMFACKYLGVIKAYQEKVMPEYLSLSNSIGLLYTDNQNHPQLKEHFTVIQDLTKINPYWLLYDLIKNQERDGRAFVQLLKSIQYYGDKARNYHDKIQSNAKDIENTLSGKKNLKSFMAKGTPEEIKYQLQVENQELKKQKEQSQMLRDIVTALVAFIQIQQCKNFKKQFYLSTIEKLSKLQSNFAEGFTVIWNEVLLGLQKIGQSYSSS